MRAAALGPSWMRSWAIIWPDAGAQAAVSKTGHGGCRQRVPGFIEIRSVTVDREPIHHGAGQPIHLHISLLEQGIGVFSDAVEPRELQLRMPAQHGLQSRLSTSPTSGVEQDVDPTRDGFQESPDLCSCGIRSFTLVRGCGNQNLWLKYVSGRADCESL